MMSQHAKHSASKPGLRPPLWRRMVRGTRQFIVLVLLGSIILALGTTAVTGAVHRDEAPQEPSVEEHVAALSKAAARVGDEAPNDVVLALQSHPELIGAPVQVDPYFDWLPEVAPPPPAIAPATDLEGMTDQLAVAARATLQSAVTVEIDSSATDAAGDAVPPERVRTLVAVGMEQLRALKQIDADAAKSVRDDVLTKEFPAAGEPAVAAERCGSVAAAAEDAYSLAYLYEYGAVRRNAPRPEDAPDDAASTWWKYAAERAALGDRIADMLPDECVVLRESTYPIPADDPLATTIRSTEGQLALSLRDAAAAAEPSARPALINRALTAVHHATGDAWFNIADSGQD